MALNLAVDVNRYADYCRGEVAATTPILSAKQIYLPFVVVAELRCGFRGGSRNEQNEQRLSAFIQQFNVSVLFADEGTTHVYAMLHQQLRKAGTPIPVSDLWIAALVVQHDLALLTRDQHFERLPQIHRI